MNTTPQDEQDGASSNPGIGWDHAAVLARLGGPVEAVAAIAATGFPAPSVPTVWMWRSRKRVPAAWMPTVLLALARKGVFLTDVMLGVPTGTPPVAAQPPAYREKGTA
ncbi:hypothetical protein [Microcystis phage Mae-Yong1326-1]|nr:hypothetical protein [Microcystis phage Mae-Yong1326-1]